MENGELPRLRMQYPRRSRTDVLSQELLRIDGRCTTNERLQAPDGISYMETVATGDTDSITMGGGTVSHAVT